MIVRVPVASLSRDLLESSEMFLPRSSLEDEEDVLSDVLRAVRLTGAVFFDVEASAPWVAPTPAARKIATSVMPEAEHVIMFHAVTSGGCWAELEDNSVPPLRLSAGDIVVVAMGDPHVFCSTPGLRAPANLNISYRQIGS